MNSSLNAASGALDAPAADPTLSAAATQGDDEPPALSRLGETAPRPAPANWRGCGYRRSRTTRNGGRAA
jgi:hypothetical protein